MSGARYLVRFDDICPTMNWDNWDRVEAALIEKQIQPILAVVPENRDSQLEMMPPRADFWHRVRKWQGMGWKIALHGYEHRYETRDHGLIGLNRRSEFAGLPYAIQRDKLRKAFDIFTRQGVKADAWVAPGHSFDSLTVELLLEHGLHVISDGYFMRPVKTMGAIWIPQQIWHFRRFPVGTWTVCYHANTFSDTDFDNLLNDIACYREQIVSLDEVLADERIATATIADLLFAWGWRTAIKTKRALKS